MTSIPDVVIKNGRIVTANTAQHTRVYAGVAIVATLVATGLGGYIMGQSSAKQPPAASAAQVPDAPAGVGATPATSTSTPSSTSALSEPPESTQSLQAAVSASLKDVTPNSDNEKKFVQAQQDYLRQNRETPEQVKARLDRLAADPQALDAHNRSVMNRVTASANPAPPNDLVKAVQASQRVLQAPPQDAMTGALKAEAAVREAEGKTYVVRPGDTLWAIAQRMYGDPYQYKRLFDANPRVLAAPEHIFPGQVLRVPT
ncbi:LysM peptidoglycan-binding domain-containing protein [Limnohabitans sp.]|uniref:LysM peptidoglycan-binding domain-containing protein n=1 Tax=Limnohabitans sp. TaxID=1907725 RepID=UPI0025BFBCA4|nr:LysM peptidoglycan-binding domain-containing protein [Limnohabitans sp.]